MGVRLSNKKEYLSKATYQMDIRNIKEAIREIEQDISEVQNMIMVKPERMFRCHTEATKGLMFIFLPIK